jgi:hypothetical protein
MVDSLAVIIALIAAGAVGCHSEERHAAGRPSGAVVDAARQQAGDAATSLTATLFTELSRAVVQEPPERAVTVCGDVAQRLTADAARRDRIEIRRTALRLRNAANAPDDYERRILEGWSRPGTPPGPVSEVLETTDGGYELRYLRPIVLQPLCIRCHGTPEAIPEAIHDVLAERYPDDQATGFRPGEIRGAVSVRIRLATDGKR